MSKSQHPMSTRLRKKMAKEVHQAERTIDLEKPVSVSTKKKTPSLAAPAIKKHKQSKRTSPGTVEGRPSSPRYPHTEGGRWIKTTEKQVLNRTQRINKKISKMKKK